MEPEVTIVVTSESLPVSYSEMAHPADDSVYDSANDGNSSPTPPAGSQS